MMKKIKVAVCGELPTACAFLLAEGVEQIEQFLDATEIKRERMYHLILIYAPQAEGLLHTQYAIEGTEEASEAPIPIRLLGEPCCGSALIELRSTLRQIARTLEGEHSGPMPAVAD